MPLIDERGRLFGKVNLIDGAVALLVLVLIPLAYGAFLLFRTPVPKIVSILPAQVVERQPATLKLAGQDLRPFLHATLNGVEAAGFLVQSPTTAEIKLPGLLPGTYDLVLSDEAQELVRKRAALTVVAADTGLPPRSVATLRVRFLAEPAVLAVMKAGDVDIGGAPAVAEGDRAVLEGIDADRRSTSVEISAEGFLGKNEHFFRPLVDLTTTIRVIVALKPTGWSYKDRPVKVGAPFFFESVSVSLRGWIDGMTLQPDTAGAAR